MGVGVAHFFNYFGPWLSNFLLEDAVLQNIPNLTNLYNGNAEICLDSLIWTGGGEGGHDNF